MRRGYSVFLLASRNFCRTAVQREKFVPLCRGYGRNTAYHRVLPLSSYSTKAEEGQEVGKPVGVEAKVGEEADADTDLELIPTYDEFGIDTGPRLDLATKVENQQRIANKVSDSYRSVGWAIFGNAATTLVKFGAAAATGSSVMASEAIHSLVDTTNQGLLLVGQFQSSKPPDKRHPHGYARSAYFYSLLSGFGTFILGSTFVMYHAVHQIKHLDTVIEYGTITWLALGFAFVIEGAVLLKALGYALRAKKDSETLIQSVRNSKDPYLRAVILEDSVACIGVLLAVGGVGMSYITQNPIWDPIASGFVAILLGGAAVSLMNMNRHFLLSQAIDPDIQNGIVEYLLSRNAVKSVGAIETAYEGPVSFSFKADIDFDGPFIAAMLIKRYEDEIHRAPKNELAKLLAAYTEDVSRVIENEVYHARLGIGERFPEASFIDLQPHCTLNKSSAISQLIYKRPHEGNIQPHDGDEDFYYTDYDEQVRLEDSYPSGSQTEGNTQDNNTTTSK